MSEIIEGEVEETASTTSTSRKRSGTSTLNRPVRLGNTGKMDAKAKSKYRELSKIGNADHAMEHLVKKGYATEDTEWDSKFVTATILQLTASVPTEEAVILKAIALVLARIDFESHGQTLTDAIMHALENPLEELNDIKGITKKVEGAVEDMVDETLRIKKATEEMRAELEEVKNSKNEALTTIQQTIARMEANIKASTPRVTTSSEDPTNQPHPATQKPRATNYEGLFPPLPEHPNPRTAGPSAHLPSNHAATISRAEQKARQVLFRPIPGLPPHKLGDLTHEQLVKKANVALETLAGSRDLPKGMTFLGVNLLTRGDIVFDLNSKGAADWLKRDEIRKKYMEGFGALTEIIDREHLVVIENVPVNFEPGTDTFGQVEQTNGLEKGSILLGRWFKRKEDRHPTQRTAYMKVVFKSAEAANKAIRDRILISGRSCAVRKLLPEPRRCFNCQKLEGGHMAQQCPSDHATCATCAQPHSTQQCCNSGDPAKRHCSNCNKGDHSADSKDCPTFEQKRKEIRARNSEYLYKFFPTADDTTWELSDPTPTNLLNYNPPVEQYRAMNNRHLAWLEERQRWTEANRGNGDPSQAKRARERRDHPSKGTPTAPTANPPPTSTLRQSTLNFTTTLPGPADRPPTQFPNANANARPIQRPSSTPPTPPAPQPTRDSRPTARSATGNEKQDANRRLGTTSNKPNPTPNVNS